MTDAFWLLAAWATAFLVNFAPAFMPATTAVLSAYYIAFDLPLLAVTVGGAAASGLGRLCLALATRSFAPRLSPQRRHNAEALCAWLESRGRWKWPLAAGYSVGPFPSNALFIAAGAGKFPVARLALVFALSRAVSDTLWVWTAGRVATNARDLLEGTLTEPWALLLHLAGVVAIILVFRLPWSRWLGIPES